VKILFVGDVFGSAGRRIVREHLGHVRESHEVDLTVINGENAAGGFGITPNLAEELFNLGADVITTGNHVWDKRELIDYMKSVPDQLSPWLTNRLVTLGTDGFGRSDNREHLRAHFEVNAESIVAATLSRLARDGKFDAKKAQAAFKELGVDTEKVDAAKA